MIHVLLEGFALYVFGIFVALAARPLIMTVKDDDETSWKTFSLLWPIAMASMLIAGTFLTIVLLMSRLKLLSPDGMRTVEMMALRATSEFSKKPRKGSPGFEEEWLAKQCCAALIRAHNVRASLRLTTSTDGDDAWMVEWPEGTRNEVGLRHWCFGYRWGALEMRDAYTTGLEVMAEKTSSEDGARLLRFALNAMGYRDDKPSDDDLATLKELLSTIDLAMEIDRAEAEAEGDVVT